MCKSIFYTIQINLGMICVNASIKILLKANMKKFSETDEACNSALLFSNQIICLIGQKQRIPVMAMLLKNRERVPLPNVSHTTLKP